MLSNMRIVIAVCLLIAAAYYDVVEATGPTLIADGCVADNVPKRFIGDCSKITCNKTDDGNVTITSTLCGTGSCPPSKTAKVGVPDLNKTYPSCCPDVSCE